MPTIDLGKIVMPTGSEEEMVFHTFRGYLEAVCNWTASLYPNLNGMLDGVADAVKSQPWPSRTPTGRKLPPRAAQTLRNAWATEVLLNSPRALGGDDLVGFANLWAPVQAYYAIFNGLTALAMAVSNSQPPRTHAALLSWAASQLDRPGSPFVVPWTARVGGPPNAYTYHGFGNAAIDPTMSNLTAPHAASAPSLLATALRTTRRQQIEDRRDSWRRGLTTASGQPRKNLPTTVLIKNAAAMRPTTLFDLLWRLRVRSNYKAGDALLSGALGPADAATFHAALGRIVGVTLLTTEIYLRHLVGKPEMEASLAALPIPASLAPLSVAARTGLW